MHDDGAGESLYAAGGFEWAGTVSARNIARWDGESWVGVGAGLEHTVSLLAVSEKENPELYAVENWGFREEYLTRVSKWDGHDWSMVGDIMNGIIHSLVVFDDGSGPGLVAGTKASLHGGLMRWDGAKWVSYLGGVQGSQYTGVYALHPGSLGARRSLFASGAFNSVGQGVPATNIAQWRTCIPSCYVDCDQSTGIGVLDVFDFLCFQSSFVAGEPYACDCDTTTGALVCDLLDFLCFQDAFVGGCP